MNDAIKIEKLKKKQAFLFEEYKCMVTPEMEKAKDHFITSSKFHAHCQNQTISLFNLQEGRLESHDVATDENGLYIENDFDKIKNACHLLDFTHPDDILHTLNLEIAILGYINILTPEEIKNFCFTYQRRLRNNTGDYQCYIHQIMVAISDENHHPWLLQIITKPCILNPTNQIERYRLFSILPTKEIKKFKKLWTGVIVKLTNCEKNILHLIDKGLTSTEIAKKLSRSINTIRTHYNNIISKLSVNSIYNACALCSQLRMY